VSSFGFFEVVLLFTPWQLAIASKISILFRYIVIIRRKQFYEMCLLSDPNVIHHIETLAMSPMNPNSRRDFTINAPLVRRSLQAWIESLNGVIPVFIQSILFHSDWEIFGGLGDLDISIFMLILHFFETNKAPTYLRRLFWSWILPIPIFDSLGFVSNNNPYITLYKKISTELNIDIISNQGAFYDVRQAFHNKPDGLWLAFNVWGCRGIIE
jgi:hypothetical protein